MPVVPVRVRVASAGTGKTTSLVRRYLELIDEGVPLRRVAGVTFTRAAADELRQRVAAGITEVREGGSYLGGLFTPAGDAERYEAAARELGGAVLSTIHGFMIAGLRLNAPLLGLDPGFALMGEWEATAVFDEEVRSLLLLALAGRPPLHGVIERLGAEAGAVATRLFSKRSLAEELRFGDDDAERALERMYREAAARYRQRLGGTLLAPGEVEHRALAMLNLARARERLVARFPVVLVDEYQDVNPVQGRFFERLADAGARLELVGDPKQSIYGFRSADVAVFRRALDAAEAVGGVLPPLTDSRRHARALVRFLNRLTGALAAGGLGFAPREAPDVRAAGEQAQVEGTVELHVVEGPQPLAELRQREVEVLVERLRAHHEHGVSYDDMAVLARSATRLEQVEAALAAVGVPRVMLQGRGYYERSEIRDVYHALSVGIDPAGPSLAPFLRGPFAGLGLEEIAAVIASDAPVEALERGHPGVRSRLQSLSGIVRLPPAEAIKQLVRAPLVDGKPFLELLAPRARENVDALLFEVVARAPSDLELLLDRLDLLASQADAGDVPQSGAGVRLSTIHRSKGLEFRLVALFDTGGWPNDRVDEMLVEPDGGLVHLRGSAGYDAASAEARERSAQESHRLLYVAASRARDVLVMSGSARERGAYGWLRTLLDHVVDDGGAAAGARIVRHAYRPAQATAEPVREQRPEAVSAPWIDRRIAPHPLPPLSSPSRLVREQGAPLRTSELAPEGEDGPEDAPAARSPGAGPHVSDRELPGSGRVVGTLVHYAIGHDWHPDDPAHVANLRAQEVMFAYAPDEQERLLDDVRGLLRQYHAMLGGALPAVSAREADRAEVPFAVRIGPTVWEGVIDRLYRVGEGPWVVEDYKTDRNVLPERYLVQLGLYLHAAELALGARPHGRLIYLRSGTVVEADDVEVRAALEAAGVFAPVGALAPGGALASENR
ncbi:MAG: UvrD-helicase domain-containing protein [Trueperaceae bacterium]